MEDTGRPVLRSAAVGSALVILLMLFLSVYAWTRIPPGQPIAVHWGISGQPDGYAGKTFALLIMPVVAAVLAAVLLLVALLDPRRNNIIRSGRAYTAIILSFMLFFLALHAFMVLNALGVRLDIGIVLPILVGALFVVIGYYLKGLRSNFFAGIRTPWTLSSEFSWEKTHRLGAQLFMLLGAVLLLGVLLGDMFLWTILLFVELGVVLISLTVYSYLAWRLDPGRAGAVGPERDIGIHRIETASVVLVVAVAVVFGVLSVSVRPHVDTVAVSRRLVQELAIGDFTGAERYFDAQMRSALPPSQLRANWEDITREIGPFREQLGVRTERRFPFEVVHVTCRFGERTADVRIVFSRSGKVSGLWVSQQE